MYKKDVKIILTNAVELLLELGHVLAFSDPEIVISEIRLVQTVVRGSCANG